MRQEYSKKYYIRTGKPHFTLLTFLVFTEWVFCPLIRAYIYVTACAEDLMDAIRSRRITERWSSIFILSTSLCSADA